jgi:tRNA(fMet)-specific endonuclease VapC
VSLFLLDTNMASFAMKRHYPQVRNHLARAAKKHGIGISAVTQGELIYGLHRKDAPNELVELIRGFLIRVEVLPWDTHVADTYGQVRAWCTKKGSDDCRSCHPSPRHVGHERSDIPSARVPHAEPHAV